MLHNLNDSQLEWIVEAVLGLIRENPLESASVSDGRVRFIRGLLRMDEGARLEGVGTFDWTGRGSIAGDWEVLGGGVIRVGGVLISPVGGGRIMIGQGPVGIILDGGAGTLTMGNVRMEGGKIYVGTGDRQIVIDGATGQIIAGGMVIDPEEGGSVGFPGGAKITANDGDAGVKIDSGSGWIVYVAENGIRFGGGVGTASITLTPEMLAIGADRLQLSADELILGAPTGDISEITYWYGKNAQGEGRWVPIAQGGPMGNLEWPLPPSTVTSEYGPRESPGEGASTFHQGLDFRADEGDPIPSAGAGVVVFAGYDDEGGYGYVVVIDHGNGIRTRYAHMHQQPSVSDGQGVAPRQTLGGAGQTGVSFGVHLHFEVEVDGVKVNPRSKLPAA